MHVKSHVHASQVSSNSGGKQQKISLPSTLHFPISFIFSYSFSKSTSSLIPNINHSTTAPAQPKRNIYSTPAALCTTSFISQPRGERRGTAALRARENSTTCWYAAVVRCIYLRIYVYTYTAAHVQQVAPAAAAAAFVIAGDRKCMRLGTGFLSLSLGLLGIKEGNFFPSALASGESRFWKGISCGIPRRRCQCYEWWV